jgi:dolichol-phosphate mannosyltransferase
MKKLISIVIPAYNEAECVEELHNRLVSVFEVEKNYRFEVVIIENGSIDSTREKLKKIARKDVRFLIVYNDFNSIKVRLELGLQSIWS